MIGTKPFDALLLREIGESDLRDEFTYGTNVYELRTTNEHRPRWYILVDGDLFAIGWSRTAMGQLFTFCRKFTDISAEDHLIIPAYDM